MIHWPAGFAAGKKSFSRGRLGGSCFSSSDIDWGTVSNCQRKKDQTDSRTTRADPIELNETLDCYPLLLLQLSHEYNQSGYFGSAVQTTIPKKAWLPSSKILLHKFEAECWVSNRLLWGQPSQQGKEWWCLYQVATKTNSLRSANHSLFMAKSLHFLGLTFSGYLVYCVLLLNVVIHYLNIVHRISQNDSD